MDALEKPQPDRNTGALSDSLLATSDNLAILLAQVPRLIRPRARQIGLTRPQWQILTLLVHYEGINQCGIAEMLEVEPITLGRMIKRLLETEVVERRKDAVNRRSWQLYLTAKGLDLASKVQPIADTSLEDVLAGIPSSERAVLSDLLLKIRDNISREWPG